MNRCVAAKKMLSYLYTEVAAVDIVSQEEVLGARRRTSHLSNQVHFFFEDQVKI